MLLYVQQLTLVLQTVKTRCHNSLTETVKTSTNTVLYFLWLWRKTEEKDEGGKGGGKKKQRAEGYRERHREGKERVKESGRLENRGGGGMWVGDGTWWILLILWPACLPHPLRGLTYSSDRPPDRLQRNKLVCVCVCLCVRPLLANPLPRHEPFDPLPLVWAVCRVFACVPVWLLWCCVTAARSSETALISTGNQKKEGENKNKSTMRTASWRLQGVHSLMDFWALHRRDCD